MSVGYSEMMLDEGVLASVTPDRLTVQIRRRRDEPEMKILVLRVDGRLVVEAPIEETGARNVVDEIVRAFPEVGAFAT